jgi:hypothetical protein
VGLVAICEVRSNHEIEIEIEIEIVTEAVERSCEGTHTHEGGGHTYDIARRQV